VLDETTCQWEPPTAAPEDNGTTDENNNTIVYRWNEEQHDSTGNGWEKTLIPPADPA
jgi:hypothetical protein